MKKLLILASFLLFVFVSVESTGFTVFTFQQNKTLVKLSTNPTVYWLQNNRIYGVFASTLSTMQSNNMPGWSTINTVSSLPFPQGPNFIGTGSDSNGLLIKLTSNSAVYLVTNGKKEFLSSDEFNRRGFSFNDVIDVPQAIINMFPTAVDAMQYISQTIPDGTTFNSNTPFTMTWRLQNTGQTTWGSYNAVWIQNPTSGNPSENLSSPLRVSTSVPVASPGNAIDLTVTMIAPSTPGTHYSYWQLQNSSGNNFGIQFFIRIVVAQPVDAMQYISQNPLDGMAFDPNTPFTMTWQLKNTGNTNWSNYDAVWIQNPTSGNPSENLTS
ncbi:MAG: NBR1-Ig-like domain-containing protein, partial [Blastocatellia bacterium]